MKFFIQLEDSEIKNISSLDTFKKNLKQLLQTPQRGVASSGVSVQKPSKSGEKLASSSRGMTGTQNPVPRDLESELIAAQKISSKLEENLRNQKTTHANELQQAEKKQGALQNKIDELNEVKSALLKDLEAKTKQLESLQEKLTESQKQFVTSQDSLKTEQDSHKHTQSQLDSTKEELQTEQEAYRQTQNALVSTENALQTEKDNHKETQSQLESTQGELQTEQGSHQQTQNALASTAKALQTEQDNHKETQSQLESTQGELQIEKDAHQKTTKNLSNSQKDAQALQAQIAEHTLVHLEEYCCSNDEARQILELDPQKSFLRRVQLIKSLKSAQNVCALWKNLSNEAKGVALTSEKIGFLHSIVSIFNLQNSKKSANLIEASSGDRFDSSNHYGVAGSGDTVGTVYFYGLEITNEPRIAAQVTLV